MPEQEKRQRAPGGGMKAPDGPITLDRKQAMVDERTEKLLTKIGKGNFSLGVREAARRLKESGDIAPFDEERHALRKAPRQRSR